MEQLLERMERFLWMYIITNNPCNIFLGFKTVEQEVTNTNPLTITLEDENLP